jgi:hypothetical protein
MAFCLELSGMATSMPSTSHPEPDCRTAAILILAIIVDEVFSPDKN